MATADPLNVNPIAPFHCGEAAGIGERWKRTVCNRERNNCCSKKKSITPILCWCRGTGYILYTWRRSSRWKWNCVRPSKKKTLEKYFNPQSNVLYERLLFWNMAQNESETIEQYITRLWQKAVTCNFDRVDEELEIKWSINVFLTPYEENFCKKEETWPWRTQERSGER